MSVSRSVEWVPPPQINLSRRERLAGFSLFLAVTVCWMLLFTSWEQGWIGYDDFLALIAVALSAVSVVITGYLGRLRDAAWLGWVPGATMTAIGFAMTPTPGGDETGGTMVFFGVLLLIFGWPFYFLPLIAIGAGLRRRRVKRLAPATV
jgi:hypothetical protein